MKIISEIINKDSDFELLDIAIYNTKYSSNTKHIFSLNEIRKNNCDVCLNIDKIFSESELVNLESFIIDSFNYNIDYYIFSDMAVYNIFKKYNLVNKLIYNAKTLCCSSYDIITYNSLGIKVFVSTELPIEELMNISKLKNNVIHLFGQSLVFYSKRKLLTLYNDYLRKNGLDIFKNSIKNKFYWIKEESRSDQYPIIECDDGTLIYTSFLYDLKKEIKNLDQDNLFYINRMTLTDEELKSVLAYFKNDEALDLSMFKINDGFLYKKPFILKEEK